MRTPAKNTRSKKPKVASRKNGKRHQSIRDLPPVRKLPPIPKQLPFEELSKLAGKIWKSSEEVDEFVELLKENRSMRPPMWPLPRKQLPRPKTHPLPQNIKPTTYDDVIGLGKDLWKDDEELEEFLKRIDDYDKK